MLIKFEKWPNQSHFHKSTCTNDDFRTNLVDFLNETVFRILSVRSFFRGLRFSFQGPLILLSATWLKKKSIFRSWAMLHERRKTPFFHSMAKLILSEGVSLSHANIFFRLWSTNFSSCLPSSFSWVASQRKAKIQVYFMKLKMIYFQVSMLIN